MATRSKTLRAKSYRQYTELVEELDEDGKELKTRKQIHGVPAGHFRVWWKNGTASVPFPFTDIPNEQTVRLSKEVKTFEDGKVRVEHVHEDILLRDLYQEKFDKKLKSKVLQIEDGPAKRGRPPKEGDKEEVPPQGDPATTEGSPS